MIRKLIQQIGPAEALLLASILICVTGAISLYIISKREARKQRVANRKDNSISITGHDWRGFTNEYKN